MKRTIIAVLLLLMAVPLMAQMQFRDNGTVMTDREFTARSTLEDGLVFYSPLTLSGYIDSTFVDFSAEGNDGTNMALGEQQASVGQDSTEFNGVNDRISCGDAASLDITETLTAVSWAKNDAATPWQATIISKYNSDGNMREWMLHNSAAQLGKISINFGNPADGTFLGRWSSDDTIDWSEWHLIGFTFDKGTVVIYVDGAAMAGSVTSGSLPASLYNGTADLVIGDTASGGNPWDGALKDSRVYNRVLSPTEILELYTGEKTIVMGSPRMNKVARADSTNMSIELRDNGAVLANDFVERQPFGNPVAWYPLGNSSRISTQTADFSANANHADTTLITYGTDRFGNANEAMEFDGTSSVVIAADISAYDITETLTVLYWAKGDSAAFKNTKYLVSKYLTTGNEREWVVRADDDGHVTVNFGDPADGTLEGMWYTYDTYSWNAWTLWGFTFDRGTVVIYRNGIAQAGSVENGAIPTTLYNGTADITIGNRDGGNLITTWDGLIEDTVIFGRVLSAADLKLYYQQTKP